MSARERVTVTRQPKAAITPITREHGEKRRSAGGLQAEPAAADVRATAVLGVYRQAVGIAYCLYMAASLYTRSATRMPSFIRHDNEAYAATVRALSGNAKQRRGEYGGTLVVYGETIELRERYIKHTDGSARHVNTRYTLRRAAG